MYFNGDVFLRITFMRAKLFLIITFLASISYAADNAAPFKKPLLMILEVPLFKTEHGTEFPIRVEIGVELILRSKMLKDMWQSGLLKLHNQRDEAGNPVLSFKNITANQLVMLPDLLKFEQTNTVIGLPEHPNLAHCKAYQKRVELIAKRFEQKYPDDSQYEKICEIAAFFDISSVTQAIGQLMLSSKWDLKMLEENKYPYYTPLLQNCIAIQFKRRIALAKEQYFTDGNIHDPYFKGLSVKDYIDHGREPQISDGKLNLDRRRLNSLEGLERILAQAGHVREITLRDNIFEVIPDNRYGETDIEILDLSDNEIKAIPDEFIGWNNLKTLDVSHNKIETLPSNISGVEKLKNLDLFRNKIRTIPHNMMGLKNLEVLGLSLNEIDAIPDDIDGLENLEILFLGGNPVVRCDKKVEQLQQNLSKRSPKAIIAT